MITIYFLASTAYYLLWVLNLKTKMPPDMAAFIVDAVLGYSKKMYRELDHNLTPAERARVQDAKNALAQKW